MVPLKASICSKTLEETSLLNSVLNDRGLQANMVRAAHILYDITEIFKNSHN